MPVNVVGKPICGREKIEISLRKKPSAAGQMPAEGDVHGSAVHKFDSNLHRDDVQSRRVRACVETSPLMMLPVDIFVARRVRAWIETVV
jgi:hypothetical protein